MIRYGVLIILLILHFNNNRFAEGAIGPLGQTAGVYEALYCMRATQPFLLALWAILPRSHVALRLWLAFGLLVAIHITLLVQSASPLARVSKEAAAIKRLEVDFQLALFISACAVCLLASAWFRMTTVDELGNGETPRASNRRTFGVATLFHFVAFAAVLAAAVRFLMSDPISLLSGEIIMIPYAVSVGLPVAMVAFLLARFILGIQANAMGLLACLAIPAVVFVGAALSSNFHASLFFGFIFCATANLLVFRLVGFRVVAIGSLKSSSAESTNL